MIRQSLAACIVVATLAFAAGAFAQLSPDEALSSFELGLPEFRVELVAAEPLVESPCAMAFDEAARLYVAENRGYPNTANPPQGTIALLEDTDGDGRMDKRTVFADGLTFPNGVMPWKGGLIVTCAPDVIYFRDKDGDGRADERRILLTGFDATKSTQLRVNAPTLGPDGWIYLAAGLAGGSITSPEHPERLPLKMTADVRFHPVTLEIEHVDGRSQYGMSFDEFGRRFICMNRLPVQHVVLSSKLLARNSRLAFSETVQDCNERSVKTGLKGGGDGVKLFPISRNITTADSHAGSFSAACSVHIWQGEALGLGIRDCALSCDPTANLVHADKLTLENATFRATPLLQGGEFLASRDDWFRPVFLAPGPDGALYVVDMYRKVIEHPDYLPEEVRKRTEFGSGKIMGRIWRITSPKTGEVPIIRNLSRADTPTLVDAIDAQAGWARTTAARLLLEQQQPGTAEFLLAALHRPATSHAQYQRVRLLNTFGDIEDARLAEFLTARDYGISRAALEIAPGRVPSGSAACRALVERNFRGDDEWFLQLLALGGVADWRAYALFADWSKSRGQDRWARAAILSSVGDRDEEFIGALHHQMEFPVAAQLFSDLRGLDDTRTALEIFKRAADGLRYGRLTGEDQLLIIRLLGRSQWDIAGDVLTAAWSKATDDATHIAAATSLLSLDVEKGSRLLLAKGDWTHYSPTLREGLLNVLLARRGQIELVLSALESGELPPSALNLNRRQLFTKHADANIRERAGKLFAQAEVSRNSTLERAKEALALTPKAEHGREVFRQLCATCHRLDREGVAVGPDLLDIRNQTKENILFHIVVPEAEIAPAFAAYSCETKDGRGFAGILASETASSVTIRQPGGAEETILRADLKALQSLPNSLMPTGLDTAMSQQDLADLLAFLKGEK
jgi:putative membrane-bound dehydrogenase-like protein